MKVYIEIKEPRNLYDSYGKRIKGPVKPLLPFESIDKAIEWLKMIDQRCSDSAPKEEP